MAFNESKGHAQKCQKKRQGTPHNRHKGIKKEFLRKKANNNLIRAENPCSGLKEEVMKFAKKKIKVKRNNENDDKH